MPKRIYTVTILTTPQTTRLVEAHTAAEARRHVWDRLTAVEVASQAECVRLTRAGVEVEVAGEGRVSAISQLPIADLPELPAHMDRRAKTG